MSMAEKSFFDFREQLLPPRGNKASAPAGKPESMLTVSQLTKLVDKAIRGGMPASVSVRGEVSNFAHNRGSGHAYFTLKDADACLNCVMFRGEFERLKFVPQNGMELLATGNVRVFAAQGKYQLYVNTLQPLGKGALELAFAQLRLKLETEGLFSAERKRPLPRFPSRIVIITSRETAALADMLKILRRFPWLRIILCHVPVQGESAARQITGAVAFVNQHRFAIGNPDLILLGRGGGSLEDLWAFNDEMLARAIFASQLPIITGIGHEVDVSIADLVADHHAHTPTEAASVATAHWRNVNELLAATASRLLREIRSLAQLAEHRLTAIRQHEIFRRPTDRIDDLRSRIDDRQQLLLLGMHRLLRDRQTRLQTLTDRLQRQTPAAQIARGTERLRRMQQMLLAAVQSRHRRLMETLSDAGNMLAQHHPRGVVKLQDARLGAIHDRMQRAIPIDLRQRGHRIENLSTHLEALSPQRVLERGYSVTRLKKAGTIVRSVKDLRERDRIITRFHDGEVESVVEDPQQPKLFD
jgi:exodeoxyribonuclease VII large subunit